MHFLCQRVVFSFDAFDEQVSVIRPDAQRLYPSPSVFCVFFRKSFPLATKTRTRGSTSASSPSTWRTTRRSYGSPSRAWTKTMTVRWSDISGKLTVYGFNSGSKIKPKSKKLNAGNWTWFLLRSSNLSWQWKRICLRYSWQKYQDFCVFIFNRSDRFHGGKAVACRSGTGHQQRGGREDPQ